MAAQEDVKGKRPAAKITGEGSAKAAVASEIPVEDLALSTRVLNTLTNAGVATVQDILDMLDGGKKIPGVADKTLEEIRNRLAEKGLLELKDENAEVERERQALLEAEQAGAEPEMTLAEPTKGGGTERENMEPSLTALERKAERRVSFSVNLTVDENGRTRRIEVQHAHSDKRKNFPASDVQRLVTFMEECARIPVAPEATIPPTRPPAKVEASKPKASTPVSGLTVSDVRVFRKGAPGVAAVAFRTGEDLVVQVGFQVQGLEASAFSAHEEFFEVNVFAYEVTSGTSRLLSTDRNNLVENVLEYTPQIPLPGLSPGLYRLTTVVRLPKTLDQHEGPAVHIIGVRPSGNPVAPQESALSP